MSSFKRFISAVSSRLGISSLLISILAPFHKKIISLDYEKAYDILNSYSPKPPCSLDVNNTIEPVPKYDLQIIVPAYNVEQYLKECIDSIVSQESDFSYCLIIIDDGSTDKTGEIADTYSSVPGTTVIHTPKRGVACARNAGLKKIIADYIMFVDSDDSLEPGAIQKLMTAAKAGGADIVQGRYYNYFSSSQNSGSTYKRKGNRTGGKRSPQPLYGMPWGKVFKSALFEHVNFPENHLHEDSVLSFLVYPSAQVVQFIPDFIYNYRIRHSSATYTSRHSPRCIDTYWITELLVGWHEMLGLPHDASYDKKIIRQFLLNAKRIELTDEIIQTSVFVCSACLFARYFKENSLTGKELKLANEILKGNFGYFSLYAKMNYR